MTAPITDADAVRIEPLADEHLDEVVAIEEQVQGTPWSRSLFEEELAARHRVYVAAVDVTTGRTLGYAGAILVAEEAHVSTVAVTPEAQGRGLATRLVVAMLRGSVDRGAVASTLEVRVSNSRAAALYQRFGFAPAGIRRRYYSDNGEDALIMWVHDIDTSDYAARLDEIEAAVGSSAKGAS